MKGYKKRIGSWGEELAEKYLVERGYTLVAKNWRARDMKILGEIDLIMTKDQEVVFVEVKTRATPAFGYGEQAVTYSKKQKLTKAINQYLTVHPEYDDCFPRFDILVVEIFQLTPNFIHFENVALNC